MAYNKNETLVFKCLSYSDSGKTTLADADSTAFTLLDPSGTSLVTAQAGTRESTGTYTYSYTMGVVLGLYTYKWSLTKNAQVTIEYGHFVIEE